MNFGPVAAFEKNLNKLCLLQKNYRHIIIYCTCILQQFTVQQTERECRSTDYEGCHLSLCMRQPTIWVPTRTDTNWVVQSQKMVRGWKFWI